MATVNPQVPIFDQQPADVQTRLTEFATDFLLAYQGVEASWAEIPGAMRPPTSAAKTSFPVSIDSPEFKELIGDIDYQRLCQKSIEAKTKKYAAGVKEYADYIESNEFLGWEETPKNHAIAARNLAGQLIAAALKAGKTTASWENPEGVTTVKFFDASHPNHPFNDANGTYGNLKTSFALTYANVKLARQLFRKMKGPNGKTPRGMRLTHILVDATNEETANDLATKDRIVIETGAGATKTSTEIQNDLKGKFIPVVSDELDEEGVWYPFSLSKPGQTPWKLQRRVAPKRLPGLPGEVAGLMGDISEWRVDDKSSTLYKHGLNGGPSGQVAIAAILEMYAALMAPWTILRCEP